MLLAPIVRQTPALSHMLHFALTLLLAAGVYSVSSERKHFVAAAALGFLGVALIAASSIVAERPILLATLLVEITFFSFIATLMLSRLVREQTVSADTILGSVCVYLLIGVSFSFIFMTLEVLNPGSFTGLDPANGLPSEPTSFFLYFSFITLSTVGYGDIAPLTEFGRTLAALEGIVGQMYIAILVAHLVAIHTMQRRESLADDDTNN